MHQYKTNTPSISFYPPLYCEWICFLLSVNACVLSCSSCLTLCDPMDCSLPGSSVNEISQARILEWIAIFFSRGSSRLRGWTHVSCIGGQILYHWAPREAKWRLTICKPKIFSQRGMILHRQTLTKVHTESFTQPSTFLPHLHFISTAKDSFSVWVCVYMYTVT